MTGSVGALALRMIISLGVVLGLMWVAARVLSGRNAGKGGTGLRANARRAARGGRPAAVVNVVGRTSVGKSLNVTVVEACGRTLVLGVTPHAINVLASDDAPLDSAAALATLDATSLNNPVLDVGRSLVPTAGRTPTAPGWKPVLDALRERTVRRP